ncbi:MAG: hypothetical protein CMM48_17660 [Rhodospirillaceae bacterium]|nr:hypothetical protein [Rhodospirillaceae bacterium]
MLRLATIAGTFAVSTAATAMAAPAASPTDTPNAAYKGIDRTISVAQANTDTLAKFNRDLKEAERGLARGQNNVGRAYMNGRGVNRDYKKAREWFDKAAAQNYMFAFYNIGELYSRGWGEKKDFIKAKEFYLKSAAWAVSG